MIWARFQKLARSPARPSLPIIRRRGQLLPLFVGIMVVLTIIAALLWNQLGFSTAAQTAMTGAARTSGQAGLRQIDDAMSATGRWFIDGAAGDATTRDYIYAVLYGDGESNGYRSLIADSIENAVYDLGTFGSAGTADETESGVDVEIINPVYSSGGDPVRYFNTTSVAATTCLADDDREGIIAELDGFCYADAAIIVRLSLDVNQFGSLTSRLTVLAASSAGTNVE